MRVNTKLTIVTGIAIILVVGQCTNAAASILSLIQPGPNQGSDEDREYLIDRDVSVAGSPGFGIKGQIDVGDSFRGHIDFNTLNSGGANVGGLTGQNELSGLFQVMVTAKIPIGAGVYRFIFGPDPTFLGGATPGAIIQLHEDSTPDFAADFNSPAPAAMPPADSTPLNKTSPLDDGTGLGPRTVPPSSADVSVGPYVSEEAFIATASDGPLFATFGFAGVFGEGFEALSTSGDNVLAFFGILSGSNGASNDFSLSRLDGGAAGFGDEIFDAVTLGPTLSKFPAVGTPFVGIVGSQQLRGVADLDTSFEISTNTNVSFNVLANVPEPLSAVVWLGLVIAGLAANVRCRAGRNC